MATCGWPVASKLPSGERILKAHERMHEDNVISLPPVILDIRVANFRIVYPLQSGNREITRRGGRLISHHEGSELCSNSFYED